jgi:FkbM family methyltransferase
LLAVSGAAGVLAAIARLPGRRFPIKGWSLATERLHPLIAGGVRDATYRTAFGVSLRLDLEDYTQRTIFYDAFEVEELNFLRLILWPGDVLLDAGAGADGIFTLVGAQAVGAAGEVHAFEPVPSNYRRLTENIALNRFGNVRANRMAVGAKPGSITLALTEDMARASGREMSGFYAVGPGLREATAPVVPLDAYLAENLPGRQVRVLKMDIEGYEPTAIAGLSSTLARGGVDVMMIEVSVYALARQGSAIADLVMPLQAAGYALHRLRALGRLRRWRYAGEPTIPLRRVGRTGLLRNLYMGLQDLGRNFNLIALRPR